jgi:hypothetical protein
MLAIWPFIFRPTPTMTSIGHYNQNSDTKKYREKQKQAKLEE